MTRPKAKNLISAIYIIGYWLYWFAAAISAWGNMSFYEWWKYVAFQMIYAVFWPIFLLLAVF